jgi:hypothetical protein
VSIAGRVKQGVAGLLLRSAPGLPPELASLLSPALQAAFRRLPPYDQQHLIAVTRCLADGHAADPELLRAGLLHDLGKAALGSRVRLPDRVAHVLLAAIAPRLLDRVTRLPAPRWRLGLALTRHHPALGAAWARELGCSERTAWLIAHHADDPPPDDPALRRLIACDRAAEAG